MEQRIGPGDTAAVPSPSGTSRVVVVGAGFAGLAAAQALAAPVGPTATSRLQVVLVDRHNFHTFQPLLYQVATAGLEAGDVAYPVRTVFRRRDCVRFRHGTVVDIDADRRTVQLDDGTSLQYDALVVSSGVTANFFEIPGAAQQALPLYVLADARRLRNRLLGTLEAVDAHPERYGGGAPAFVVVGAGPTGVETAGALVELLSIAVRRDRLRIDPERTRVILVDALDRLLPGFRPEASTYAEATLRHRGVEVRLGCAVEAVQDDCVVLTGGEHLPAHVVVWAAGVTAAGTTADRLPGQRAHGGRIVVADDLSLPGYPDVFVVGDAAAVPDGRGGTAPQLAPVAIQSGRHAGQQIRRRLAGEATEPLRYRDKGIMATIGRRAAVAQVPGLPTVRGTVGWLAWLLLHLVYLVGFRNRVMVLVNWCWRYVEWPSGPRVIVADPPAGTPPRIGVPAGQVPEGRGPDRQVPGGRGPD